MPNAEGAVSPFFFFFFSSIFSLSFFWGGGGFASSNFFVCEIIRFIIFHGLANLVICLSLLLL